MKRWIVAVLAMGMICGCGQDPQDVEEVVLSDQQPMKVTVGASPVASSAGIFLAYEQGYFAEQGLDVDITAFKHSGAPMTVLLASGKLDVGAGSLSAGLWNAMNQGENLRLVADKGHQSEGHGYMALLVRTDHIESGRYKTYADLKGFKMASSSLNGTSIQIITDRFLEAGGKDLADVDMIKLGFPDVNLALAKKLIDAAVQLEPFISKAELSGTAKKIASAQDIYPGAQTAAIFYSPHFIAKGREFGEKFMIAYLKGVRDYENAFIHGVNREQITALLKRHVKIADDAVWNNMIPIGLNPDGYLNTKVIADDMTWYKDMGFIERIPDMDTVVDHSFVDAALVKLGRYSPPTRK